MRQRKLGTSIGTEALGTEAKIDASLTANQDNTTEKSKSKTWNNSSSKQKSNSSSESSTNSTALSSKVSDTYGYNKSHSEGGSETTASSSSNTSSSSQEYATALTYSTQKTETTSKTYSNAEAPEGYYRMVCAGTIHVFAVVGYDIASSSYYVYTYGVQDDDTYDFIDYSKQTHSFDDYENGILPFEVPFEVNQYIDNALLRSKGLVYDSETGTVVDYTGEGTDLLLLLKLIHNLHYNQ